MVISLRKLATILGAVVVLAASPSYALPVLDGSLPLTGVTITQDGANLAVSTLVSAADTIVSGPGLDDYSPVTLLASFGPHTLDLSSAQNLADNFTLSNATWGSFAATSGIIVQQTASFLDVFLSGIFTPGPGLPGAIASETSLRISVNQSGDSLSEAITLNSPPVPPDVPEPTSLALLGSGLAGLALLARKRSR